MDQFHCQLSLIMLILYSGLPSGCQTIEEPSTIWVNDLSLTGPDVGAGTIGDPVVVPAWGAIDLRASFTPAPNIPEKFDGRHVHPPSQWRLRAEIYDPEGKWMNPTQDYNLLGPLHDYDQKGAAAKSTLEAPPATPFWKSPEKPLGAAQDGTQYRWGYVWAPQVAGEYALVIQLYPTAEVQSQHVRMRGHEYGAGVEVFRTTLIVDSEQTDEPRRSAVLSIGPRHVSAGKK